MKRKYKILCIILAVLFIAAAAMAYISVPDTLVLYKDSAWEKENIGFKIMDLDGSIEVSGTAIVPRRLGEYSASLSVFGIQKPITLRVLEEKEVIPGGETIGIRLYSDGLVVLGVGKINGEDRSPAEKAGIASGDVIVSINGEKVSSPEKFSQEIARSDNARIKVKRGSEFLEFDVVPEKSEYDGVKRIGLWVRDSTAGVGTLTFIDPETGVYGALGHSVSDTDTGVRFEVLEGSIERCGISAVRKSSKGAPGELEGIFYKNAENLGDIQKNTVAGIFGSIKKAEGERCKVALKNEIEEGPAVIRTSIDGESVEEYTIEILRVSQRGKNPSKALTIAVTDERLIEKTGGIVQGMSGSPIIQNGKFVGAVTHVLVNDPTKGYGVLAETMLENAVS